MHEWKFGTSNTEALFEQLSQIDRGIFNFNIKEINWPKHLEDYWFGIRKYVLKDKMTGAQHGTTSVARKVKS